MNLLSIAGVAIVGLLVAALIRQVVPEMATLFTLALGVVLFALIIDSLGQAIESLEGIADRAGVQRGHVRTVLKVIGVSYIASFAAQMCKDAGESALAAKVELAGKVVILLAALPVFRAIADGLERLARLAL
jgi:stage III sporulation protein AD